MALRHGDQLEHELLASCGDFLCISNGVPHVVINASDSEPAVAVLARTDANEQEDVTTLPHLQELAHLCTETPR
jgi:uncharacterized RmlC-like cupin family protein